MSNTPRNNMSTAPIAAPSRRAAASKAAAPGTADTKPKMPTKQDIEALCAAEPGLKFAAARMRLYRAAKNGVAAVTNGASSAVTAVANKAVAISRKAVPAPPVAPARASRTAKSRTAAPAAPVGDEREFVVTVVDVTSRKSKTAFIASASAGEQFSALIASI